MKKWTFLIALMALSAPAAMAQSVVPNFTQGSMTSTTVTETTIDETIVIEREGGAYTSYSGFNINPSGALGATGTTYSVKEAGDEFQLEITTRAAGVIETETITREIEQTTTKNSLSIFSQ